MGLTKHDATRSRSAGASMQQVIVSGTLGAPAADAGISSPSFNRMEHN